MLQPEEQLNKPLSVSAAMALAKGALESCTVTLVGEVSELSNKAGYKAVYFTVKDKSASLPCMMWQNRFAAAGIDMRVGSLVQMTGRFTLYAAKGRMNFDVFKISLAGEGDLRQKVADLARKLQNEGLMDASRKRPLPSMPARIGVVTSPRGAAVHDVLRTLRRRFPLAQVLLAGVPVEGAGAPQHLIAGLQTVADAGAEVVLLVRGGGSFEDLMPFNDESLARAIAGLSVPVVTGIGHEPDTSIADMVSDVRASTPTAAAEAVSPATDYLDSYCRRSAACLYQSLHTRLDRSGAYLAQMADRPVLKDPRQLFMQDSLALDAASDRLNRAIPAGIQRDRANLQQIGVRLQTRGSAVLTAASSQVALKAARLNDLSPLAILSRGYAMTRTLEGAVVKSVDQAPVGSSVQVVVSDGSLSCRVEDTAKRA